ncbi:MAG: transcription-repair coupling factor, partial [Chloroflexales bacterium]|nr:transcription-repair coupling factor [Chloroflexales bacterium]
SRLTLVDLSNNDIPIDSTEPFSDLQFTPTDLFGGQLRRLVHEIVGRLRRDERVAVVTPQAARIHELVVEAYIDQQPIKGKQKTHSVSLDSSFAAIHGGLDAGWRSPDLNLTLYTDSEIFGWRQRRPIAERRQRRERNVEERAAFLRGLKVGDYVVHIEHGIAVYEGLLRRKVGDVEREYLNLRYAGGDRLYVPVDQVDRVARYIGSGDAVPQLTRLGAQEWERAKRKARAAVRDLANELLAIYSQRQLREGHAFSPDNEWQRELENAFPYVETDDQLHVLADVKNDMELSQPMDRLICGDVGFGKTEVALRAAFKAIQDNKQVAILVPTTVLAQQHYETFRRRMAAFPVTIEMLSRFRSAKEQDAILKQLVRGQVDIIIGTHRLLSKDVSFKNLGLVIVDEEQRFGVRHKERLKQLRAEVDVLTLTATPIPRTLHMSLAGIRDLSVIDTPPEDRVPIKTYVVPYEESLIAEAIRRELERGGQIYFVHNRVHSIYHVANRVRHLVPEADIGVAHGQLDERELERVMLDFFDGKYDVLVCTTIIESGLDVPNANTIIIDDATNYGLAQLYQLRGRVGRSAHRAYAYLLYKGDRAMTEAAQQRLQAIQEATDLGAGFRVAMRDLEIRGAGNLLGAEQSGHIAAVGFDLYSRLLEQAVSQLKARFDMSQQEGLSADQPGGYGPALAQPESIKVNEKVLVSPLVTLDLPLTAYLPENYIDDAAVRLAVYQRMVEAQSPEEVRSLRQELRDRFGELPDPATHLLIWLQIKALALDAGVSSVVTTNEEFIVRLPILKSAMRERLRRRFGRDSTVKIGPQFVRLDRRELKGRWVEKLVAVLEVLGHAV